MKPRIDIPQAEIDALCRRHNIRRLSLFGSVLRDDFGPESDIDVLVEFEPDAKIGYFALVTMQNELAEILGREVDLGTRSSVEEDPNYLRRNHILSTAEDFYER